MSSPAHSPANRPAPLSGNLEEFCMRTGSVLRFLGYCFNFYLFILYFFLLYLRDLNTPRGAQTRGPEIKSHPIL